MTKAEGVGSHAGMPLSGVRVLDVTQALAGPFGSRILGDLGAELIKVEQPGIGDSSRGFPPYFLEGESAYFLGMNRNKKGITLNLKAEKGQEIFKKLVKVSDVVFENFRPGVMDRLGLGYGRLKEVNPRIIYCAISGFGDTGPWKDKPAFDGIIQALGGVMTITGTKDTPPFLMGYPIGDLGGGLYAVQGILAALYAREQTGMGQEVSISLLDVQIALQAHIGQLFLASGKLPEPIGSGHQTNVPVGAFEAKDGRYIQVSCPIQQFYENLAGVISNIDGFEGLAEDPRFETPMLRIEHKEELEEILRRAFKTRIADEWVQALEAGYVPCGKVNNLAEATSHPQVLHRNMIVEVDHPKSGKHRSAGNPIKMSQIQEEVFDPAPLLGQHNEEVLTGLLDYSLGEVDSFRKKGVI
ncbi:MAG: CaiB/BaiF CoA transferase family protein [Dehalococcoidia bacterium]